MEAKTAGTGTLYSATLSFKLKDLSSLEEIKMFIQFIMLEFTGYNICNSILTQC